ncbi:DUF5700 domain-containing putative Zn-dependent protease [Fastidiosipila sanguinis]|nr:DUF5700 domain-containing putative Zn-dependent protease [Fastidiosipila sanguinis]
MNRNETKMRIDDSLILDYLSEQDISQDWIFYNLIPGEHKFEEPEVSRYELMDLNDLVKDNLINFRPLNQEFFDEIFPDWRNTFENDLNIRLIVGCPYPFDAMTRIKDGEQVIIFDLNRINTSDPDNLIMSIRRLVTHELFHALYAKDSRDAQDMEDKANIDANAAYQDELLQLVFDEGFAHYLSVDDILKANYQNFREEHYQRNLSKLNTALEEKDPEKQKQFMTEASAGNFFDKFAAITGMFILIDNEAKLVEIYKNGYEKFLENALEQ